MSTKTLRLGTGICLVNQCDPILTAKLVASIDQLSCGRFLFGIGNGWHEEEMRKHGTAFAMRHQLVQERVEAMRVIWTQEKAEYHGEFVNFGPMIANPKPVRQPCPPVIVGRAFPYAARRAVKYGDGWYALTGARYGDEFAFIPKFQNMLANVGRDRSSCPITICLYPESGWMYDLLYCAPGSGGELTKRHKSQLAWDGTSCRSPLANCLMRTLPGCHSADANIGQGGVFDDPVEVAEGRGSGPGDRNSDQTRVRRQLSGCDVVPDPDQCAEPAPGMTAGRVPRTSLSRSTPNA